MSLRSDVLYSCLCSDLLAQTSQSYDSLVSGRARERLFPGSSVKDFRIASLFDSLLKKFEDESSDSADAVALSKFLECNEKCRSSSGINYCDVSEIEMIAIGETKAVIHDFWLDDGDYWLNPTLLFHNGKMGPGASVGVKGASAYEKLYSGPLTTTEKSLYSLYQEGISGYRLEEEAEQLRFDQFGGPCIKTSSKLSFAVKNADVSRTICTEPSLNMFFQQGLGRSIRDQLRRVFSIDLEDQAVINRSLAREGSVNGAFGTIDLSSASDTISVSLCRELFPSYIMGWLMQLRCASTILPDGRVVPLAMISSMGNGYTFPLQTLIFASVVVGCYKALGLKIRKARRFGVRQQSGNFSVFGDDIIVSRHAYDLVCKILGRFGFTVNFDKSFNSGAFRESCGKDLLSGMDVRGVYCHSLKSRQDVCSLYNRLHAWACNSGVPLSSTLNCLLGWLGTERRLFVPPWEDDSCGIKVPYHFAGGLLKHNPNGSVVYKCYMPKVKQVSLLSYELHDSMLSEFNSLVWRVPRNDVKLWRRLKEKCLPVHLKNNPAGIILSALSGHLRDGCFSIRQRTTAYAKRIRVAPCWDYHDMSRSSLTSAGWRRFKNGALSELM